MPWHSSATTRPWWPESDRLARAINNLLDNAIKYSSLASVVEVALHEGDLTVRAEGLRRGLGA